MPSREATACVVMALDARLRQAGRFAFRPFKPAGPPIDRNYTENSGVIKTVTCVCGCVSLYQKEMTR
jgi:hypothetical protein